MAQLDGMHNQRRGETPKSSNAATMEQLLHGDDAGRWSPHSTSPTLGKFHDMEDDHAHHHKKSVLTKVKEKAKKLRNSLSKKKHGEDGNSTPAWGVSLDDDEDEDPEYLGAPMYESEMAPDGYKETARQHPRAVPVISEKHVLASSVKQNSPDTNKPIPETANQENATGNQEKNNFPKALAEADTENQQKISPKTLTETVTEKLAPAYATVSDATQAIASKIQSLSVSVRGQPAPAAPEIATKAPVASDGVASGQIWDKGVSVKEYLMQKLEPGENEKALSQVISQAMSPRRSPDDVGVVEKVRGAVTSLLWNEESSQQPTVHHSSKRTSSDIPISTYAQEQEISVVEEENHGRILQAN